MSAPTQRKLPSDCIQRVSLLATLRMMDAIAGLRYRRSRSLVLLHQIASAIAKHAQPLHTNEGVCLSLTEYEHIQRRYCPLQMLHPLGASHQHLHHPSIRRSHAIQHRYHLLLPILLLMTDCLSIQSSIRLPTGLCRGRWPRNRKRARASSLHHPTLKQWAHDLFREQTRTCQSIEPNLPSPLHHVLCRSRLHSSFGNATCRLATHSCHRIRTTGP